MISFDMDAFDRLFEKAYSDPETEIKRAEHSLESAIRTFHYKTIRKAIKKGNVNKIIDKFSPLILSFSPSFYELTIQNLLSKDYLYSDGPFEMKEGGNTSAEASKAAMNLKKIYSQTLKTLLTFSKEKRGEKNRRLKLYKHTLYSNFFSNFYPGRVWLAPCYEIFC